MIRVKSLNEAEQEAVGYKLETSHQTQTHPKDNRPSGGKGGFGSPYV
jgi:hypothetical protein